MLASGAGTRAEKPLPKAEAASTGAAQCGSASEGATGLQPYDASPSPRRPGAGVLTPIAALLELLDRLIERPSTFGSLFAILQFLAGLLVMIGIGWGKDKGRGYYLLGLPLGTVFFGCVAGWCTQMLMLAGLWLFGWFTQLAALCCGSAGLAFFGYEFCLKAAEVKAHELATHTLTGH